MQATLITRPAFKPAGRNLFVATFCPASPHDALVLVGESPASKVYKLLRYGILTGFGVEAKTNVLIQNDDLVIMSSPPLDKSHKHTFESGLKYRFPGFTSDLIWVSSGEYDILAIGRKV